MAKSALDLILDKWESMILTEMAFSRKEVRRTILSDSKQVVENWCLIRYSRLTGYAEGTVEHWKTELSAAMSGLTTIKITKTSSEAKRRLFKEVWDKLEYTFDVQSVWNTIYHKFRVEKIDTTQVVVRQVCKEFIKESTKLMDLMSGMNVVVVDDYVDSL